MEEQPRRAYAIVAGRWPGYMTVEPIPSGFKVERYSPSGASEEFVAFSATLGTALKTAEDYAGSEIDAWWAVPDDEPDVLSYALRHEAEFERRHQLERP